MNDVPFLNVEYIFVKIYDGILWVLRLIFGGNFTLGPVGAWLATILTICFLVFLVWAIYIRVRIYEVDEDLSGGYDKHFVKFEPKKSRVNERWEKISEHFSSNNPNDWKSAILNADIMLDELVSQLGYSGEGLGEKLKTMKTRDFPTLHSAWEAHKIRNKIAHQADYHLSDREKEVARKHFTNVFHGAGMI